MAELQQKPGVRGAERQSSRSSQQACPIWLPPGIRGPWAGSVGLLAEHQVRWKKRADALLVSADDALAVAVDDAIGAN